MASPKEVEAFVGKLRDYHGSLGESERAMLGTILEDAMAAEAGGYLVRVRIGRYEDATEERTGSGSRAGGRNDPIGRIEEQGEDDTQGFGFKAKW